MDFWQIEREPVYVDGEIVAYIEKMICKPKWVIDMSYRDYKVLITPHRN